MILFSLNLNKYLIFIISLTLIAGIVIGNFFIVDIFYLFCLLLLMLFVLIIIRNNKKLFVIFCFIFLALVGFIRAQTIKPDFENKNKIHYYNGQDISFDAKVIKSVNKNDYRQITVESLKTDFANISGKVLVNVDLYPFWQYGDRLRLTCNLSRPEKYEKFDYARYLSRYDIYSICNKPRISQLPAELNFKDKLLRFVFSIKSKLALSLDMSVKKPPASLLSAVALGDKRALTDEQKDLFSKVGISHLTAVSGMHIAILIHIVLYLLIWLGLKRQQAFWPTVIIIFVYIAMIGLPASAVRAAIMVFLYLLAGQIGRLANSANVLGLTAAIMLTYNPLLFFDVGFQLSFTAVSGILYLSPIIKGRLIKLPSHPIKDLVVITLSAQLATLPLVIYYFNRLSIIGVLANLLVVPLAPVLMIAGFINALLAMIWLPLGRLVGYFSWLVGQYVFVVAKQLALWPFSYVEINNFGWFWLVGIYGALIYLVISQKKELYNK